MTDKIPLTDGGIHVVCCSNCNAPLVEVWSVRPEQNTHNKVRANCPHCGDKSFIYECDGGFLIGHTEYTSMIDFEYTTVSTDKKSGIIEQTILVKTEKVKQWKK